VPVMAAEEAERTLTLVRTFVERVHLATAGQLPDVVFEAARTLGWTAVLYVVDYEQRVLLPAPLDAVSARRPQGIDSSLAGRCFRAVEPVPSMSGESVVWLPVVDGADRLGVLEVHVPEGVDLADATFQERCRLLGHLTGHLIAAKRPYGDALDQLMRLRPRTVASELLYQILPPLTFACEGLVISGLLQPAYDVAADAFDYTVVDDTAHLAVLDATGHDLNGTLLAAVALTGYRNSRRNGHGLYAGAEAMDELLAVHGGGERFATGILAELELASGRLRYLNAGHPAPLLMRGGKVVKQLDQSRRILFGLGDGQANVAEEWLEPGDRVVFYTDGIT
jgi:Stage II sporulation protein E (SpoIIE)